MTSRTRIHPNKHIADLLPAYINGTLDQETRGRVHTHLGLCESCRNDLAEWEVIASATRAFANSLHLPAQQEGREALSSFVTLREDRRSAPEGVDRVDSHRPSSRRTQRSSRERNKMQIAHSGIYPHQRRGASPRWLQWVAAMLVLLLGGSSIMYFGERGAPEDPLRLPAAMQVSPEASAVAQCDSAPGALEKLDLTGEPASASLIQPPPGPYEGGFGVEASALPEGGEPADTETVDGITRTVESLVVCLNAGDPSGTAAWTSDDSTLR